MPAYEPLTSFGLFAVTAMLVFYWLEPRSPWFTLAFAGECVLGSATASFRAPGRAALSKRFGPLSLFDAGSARDQPPTKVRRFTMHLMDRNRRGVGMALLAAALFGASAPLAKLLVTRVTPQLLASHCISAPARGFP